MDRDMEIVRLEERLRALQEDLTDVKDALNGGHSTPYDRSVRGRLHKIEDKVASASLLEEALRTIKKDQAERAGDMFTRREKILGLIFMIPGAAAATLICLQVVGVIGR